MAINFIFNNDIAINFIFNLVKFCVCNKKIFVQGLSIRKSIAQKEKLTQTLRINTLSS